jgi:hypothetical protein
VLIVEWGLFTSYPLDIPLGQYRVRYSCRGMDLAAEDGGPRELAQPPADRYRLQFLPSDEWRADAILKVSSNTAMRRNAIVG